jgi:serine O-acetyltransferase
MNKIKVFFTDFKNIFSYIKKDINSYLEKDPVSTSVLKVIFISTSFQCLALYRIYHFLYLYKLYIFAYTLYALTKIVYSMDIHPAAKIEAGIVIDHGFGVVIGETAEVGEGTLIYHGVTLGAKKVMKGPRHPIIGRNTVIGAGAKVLGRIYVGDSSVIGSNSVVINDVPMNSLVAGSPAIVKKLIYSKNTEILFKNEEFEDEKEVEHCFC